MPRPLASSAPCSILCAWIVLAAAGAASGDVPRSAGGAGAARGFSSYGEPMLEDAFPDTEGLRRLLDRLGTARDRMDDLRMDFSRAVQRLLRLLERQGPRNPAQCQTLARPYLLAQELGQRYLSQGRDLARISETLARLDDMGEALGLTPDYRARLKRVRDAYRALTNDYREMKYVFHEQLLPELVHVGCPPDRLVALAAASAPVGTREDGGTAGEPRKGRPATQPRQGQKAAPGVTPRPATMITFYVDNRACDEAARVVLDGEPVGTVEAGLRRGFRARSGPHKLCVLHVGRQEKCGDPGTVRRGYLHEGWTIQLRCPVAGSGP